jgi:hypothetical protein
MSARNVVDYINANLIGKRIRAAYDVSSNNMAIVVLEFSDDTAVEVYSPSVLECNQSEIMRERMKREQE